jgi:hypothetical protein
MLDMVLSDFFFFFFFIYLPIYEAQVLIMPVSQKTDHSRSSNYAHRTDLQQCTPLLAE